MSQSKTALKVQTLLISIANDEQIESLVANVLAYSLPIPTVDIPSLSQYYRQNYRPKMDEFISAFNELHLVDIVSLREAVEEAYICRINAFYSPAHGMEVKPTVTFKDAAVASSNLRECVNTIKASMSFGQLPTYHELKRTPK